MLLRYSPRSEMAFLYAGDDGDPKQQGDAMGQEFARQELYDLVWKFSSYLSHEWFENFR